MTNVVDNMAQSGNSTRLASLPGRLAIVEKIMADSIKDSQVKQYRGRAQFTFFCGQEPEQVSGYYNQLEIIGRCLEWFVFDYKIPTLCQTPAQNWFSRNSSLLSQQARQDAADCLDFKISIFEITEVHPLTGFVAVDLLRNGKTYYVDEHIINDQLEPGQVLLGRLFPHNQNYALSGMATIMDNSATRQIRKLIKSGRLKTETLLEDLDGLELENLYSRSLMDIDKLDRSQLEKRLIDYLDRSDSGIDLDQLTHQVVKASDPIDAAVTFCRENDIRCRHEIELMIAYIMNFWFKVQCF